MNPEGKKYPAETIKDVFAACNPAKPLEPGDPRYLDCSSARGMLSIEKTLGRKITLSEEPLHELVTGHRGCGKSTELLRLKKHLQDKGYFVAYFQATEDLDMNDLQYSDLILSMVLNLTRILEKEEVRLNATLLNQLSSWFAEVTIEEEERKNVEAEVRAKVGVGAPVLSIFIQFMATVMGRIKTGIESKKTIRQRLDPRITDLIDNTNLLIADARIRLRKEGYQDLVLIIDNLDRLTLRMIDKKSTTHELLFISHADILISLQCHSVFTIPISMCYSPKAALLGSIYGSNPYIVPMIKIFDPEKNRDYQRGLGTLKEIISQRTVIDKAFDPQVVKYLCQSCGGHVRDLMILVRSACSYVDDLPITMDAARQALGMLSNGYQRSIPHHHWLMLAQIHLSHEIMNEPDYQTMLYNLSVLEYMDGEPWYDVHPAVRELKEFKRALIDEQERIKEREPNKRTGD